MNYKKLDLVKLSIGYFLVKRYVSIKGYVDEIDYYDNLTFEDITASDFMRETAWVILSGGMNEKVVRKKFSEISKIFLNWEDFDNVLLNKKAVLSTVLSVFNNERKFNSIITIMSMIQESGFQNIKNKINDEGITYLKSLPYVGATTSYHLAKNLGINCSKPDRHLLRITSCVGYNSPHELCQDIAKITDEKETIIDLVLWRFATLNKQYLNVINRFLN